MPGSSKSSLRGQWVFGVQNEQGEPLAWVGRNVRYDDEYAKWIAAGRQGREPMKYRFPESILIPPRPGTLRPGIPARMNSSANRWSATGLF